MTGRAAAPFVRLGRRVPESPTVSVCILVLEDVSLAQSCLDSLRALIGGSTEVEIIVVANGTPPAGLGLLERHEDIVLVRSGTNLGFGGGNNLAAEIAGGHYLIFLNDDSTVEAGCIENLVATADRDESIGAVGCRILSADGALQEAGSVLWNDGSAAHVGEGLPRGTRAYSYVRDVDYASANGLLVRRTAWDIVGGFDEEYYPAYYEDADLCMAMRTHGYRVVYEPRARLQHLESQSTSRMYRDFLLERNRRCFAAKWAVELEDYDDRPDDDRDLAVHWAVHRTLGLRPRVLVLGDAKAASEIVSAVHPVWDAVEALAAAGWAVTVSLPAGADETGFRPGRSGRADRLADVGVDVRTNGLRQLLDATGTDLEAVVVFGAAASREIPPILRTDRSHRTEVPLVMVAPAEAGDNAVRTGPAGDRSSHLVVLDGACPGASEGTQASLLDAVARVARRLPVPTGRYS